MHVVITNILMTLDTVITPELVSQIYQDLDKGKTCGTVLYVQNKSIVDTLKKHD